MVYEGFFGVWVTEQMAKEGIQYKIGKETGNASRTQTEKTKMSADVWPAENSLQIPKWSVCTWEVIPMNEHTSAQVNNPDNSITHKRTPPQQHPANRTHNEMAREQDELLTQK